MEQDDNNVIPEHMRIRDLEAWLQRNGLPDNAEQMSQANRAAEVARLEEHTRYQRAIHESAFREAQLQEEAQQQERQSFLETLDGVLMDLTTADRVVIRDISVRKLAQSCEMVVGLASSWSQFSSDEKMRISLDEFPSSSVQEFLDVVLESKDLETVSCDAIVDCCRIAHYLLCEDVLQKTTGILMASIDTANCLSICQLADELNLPVLFERSLSHMMQTVGDLEDNDAVMDHLTPELRDRIAAIKAAIESSVHNTSGSRLYFSSLHEYIAIFAERVQYYRERLAEAREQQLHTQHGTPGWIDAQSKIDKQERRVRTLEIALAEQKKLFNSKNSIRLRRHH